MLLCGACVVTFKVLRCIVGAMRCVVGLLFFIIDMCVCLFIVYVVIVWL